MTIRLTKIENFGERQYKKAWFRAALIIFFFIFHCYIALWVHEFWHYWYGTVVDGKSCYIKYAPFGIRGFTYCNDFSLGNYAIGGLGTAVAFFIYWFFAASFPSKLSLPYDLSLFYVVINQLFYTPFEVIGLGLGYGWVYNFYWLASVLAGVVVIYIYGGRIIEYIGIGGDAYGSV